MAVSPFSDGTPGASQWPIPPNHYFDYELEMEVGHAGSKSTMRLTGAIQFLNTSAVFNAKIVASPKTLHAPPTCYEIFTDHS